MQIYALVWKPALFPAVMDWDLFVFLAFPLVFVGAYSFTKYVPGIVRRRFGLVVVVLGFAIVAPWIYSNSGFVGHEDGTFRYWENEGLWFERYQTSFSANDYVTLEFANLGFLEKAEDGKYYLNIDLEIENANTGQKGEYTSVFEVKSYQFLPNGVLKREKFEIKLVGIENGRYIINSRVYDEVSGRDISLETKLIVEDR